MSIPRDFECWYCGNNRHERCALPEVCACYVCYPRGNPFSRYEEGEVAVETVTTFLAE